MELKIKTGDNVYNVYGNNEVKVINNLKMRPEGMRLAQIKEEIYTIHFQGTDTVALESGWLSRLQMLAKDELIIINNDIVKLNQEKYNEIEFLE